MQLSLDLHLRTCVNNSDAIINDPDTIGNDDIPPLRDNMTGPSLLEDWTTSKVIGP